MSWDLKSEKLLWRDLGLGRRTRACDGRRQQGSGAQMEREVVPRELEGPDHAQPDSDPAEAPGLSPTSNGKDVGVFIFMQGGEELR